MISAMNEKMSLGSMIAELRKEKGLTQLELAEKMNVTDKAVSKWERDLSIPDAASMPRLAEILGITVDDLMNGRKPKKAKSADDILTIILKAIPLAMGVAVTVLSILGSLDSFSGFSMLGIGLFCISLNAFRNK